MELEVIKWKVRKNEEVFYIISGEGILETPEGNITISAGDTIICPASEKNCS